MLPTKLEVRPKSISAYHR